MGRYVAVLLVVSGFSGVGCGQPPPPTFVGQSPVELTLFERYKAVRQRNVLWNDEGYITEIDLFRERWIDPAMVHEFASLPHLRVLLLGQTPVGDADLAYLTSLTGLETLGLRQTKITDAGLRHLRGLPIKQLILAATAVTDEGLKELVAVPTIERLGLVHTAVTDEGLLYLVALPNLSVVHLRDTKVTDAGIEWLKRQRPGIEGNMRDGDEDESAWKLSPPSSR